MPPQIHDQTKHPALQKDHLQRRETKTRGKKSEPTIQDINYSAYTSISPTTRESTLQNTSDHARAQTKSRPGTTHRKAEDNHAMHSTKSIITGGLDLLNPTRIKKTTPTTERKFEIAESKAITTPALATNAFSDGPRAPYNVATSPWTIKQSVSVSRIP